MEELLKDIKELDGKTSNYILYTFARFMLQSQEAPLQTLRNLVIVFQPPPKALKWGRFIRRILRG